MIIRSYTALEILWNERLDDPKNWSLSPTTQPAPKEKKPNGKNTDKSSLLF